MGTLTSYPQRVARARWTPPTPEVAARLKRIAELHQRWKDAEADYKRELAVAADPEGDAIPIAHLAEEIGIERKTVYRHLGRSMT